MGKKSRQKKAVYDTAGQIMGELEETQPHARGQIKRIVQVCGIEFAQDILRQTQEVEANGGMLTLDGSRRRSPGGVFFYLAKEQMSGENRKQIFYQRKKKETPKDGKDNTPETQSAPTEPATTAANLDHLSPAQAARLKQLEQAAETLRKRIADLKKKPKREQVSLGMTQKLLANTEKQIETLMQADA